MQSPSANADGGLLADGAMRRLGEIPAEILEDFYFAACILVLPWYINPVHGRTVWGER